MTYTRLAIQPQADIRLVALLCRSRGQKQLNIPQPFNFKRYTPTCEFKSTSLSILIFSLFTAQVLSCIFEFLYYYFRFSIKFRKDHHLDADKMSDQTTEVVASGTVIEVDDDIVSDAPNDTIHVMADKKSSGEAGGVAAEISGGLSHSMTGVITSGAAIEMNEDMVYDAPNETINVMADRTASEEAGRVVAEMSGGLGDQRFRADGSRIFNDSALKETGERWLALKAMDNGQGQKLTEELNARQMSEQAREPLPHQTEMSAQTSKGAGKTPEQTRVEAYRERDRQIIEDQKNSQEAETLRLAGIYRKTDESTLHGTIEKADQSLKHQCCQTVEVDLTVSSLTKSQDTPWAGTADERSVVYLLTIGKPAVTQSIHATLASAQVCYAERLKENPFYMHISVHHVHGGNIEVLEHIQEKNVKTITEIREKGPFHNIPKSKKQAVESIPKHWADNEVDDESPLNFVPLVTRRPKYVKGKGKAPVSKGIDEEESDEDSNPDREMDFDELQERMDELGEGDEDDEDEEEEEEDEDGEIRMVRKRKKIKLAAKKRKAKKASKNPAGKPRVRASRAKGGAKGKKPGTDIPANVSALLNGTGNTLDKAIIVILGTPPILGRKEAERLINLYGGKVTKALSGKTTYALIGKDSGLKSMAQVQKFGTATITENALIKLLEVWSFLFLSSSNTTLRCGFLTELCTISIRIKN